MDKTRQAKEKAKIRLTKQTVSTKRDKNGNFLVYSADSNDAKQKSTNKFNSALVRSTKITYANLSEKNVLLTKTQPKHDFVEITRSLLGLGGSEIKSQTKRRKLFTPNTDQDYDDMDDAPESNEKAIAERGPIEEQIVDVSTQMKSFDIAGNRNPLGTLKANSITTRDSQATKMKDQTRPEYLLNFKTYGFLKSLDVSTPETLCDQDALPYRDSHFFNANKEKLTKILFRLYDEKVFDGELSVVTKWTKKFTTMPGRCEYSERLTGRTATRTARIELSEKQLTSADRLRCTLIHEMCHAAAWIVYGEKGHDDHWHSYAEKVKATFPELPSMTICHNSNTKCKYRFECDLCGRRSYSDDRVDTVMNVRCFNCCGPISIYPNKLSATVAVDTISGFVEFIKEQYHHYKTPDSGHINIMHRISAKFSELSTREREKYIQMHAHAV